MLLQVDILANAITLIERGWCKNAPARDGSGKPCGPGDPSAAAWCVTGAIYCRDYATSALPYFDAEKLVRAVLGFDLDPKKQDSITEWNDNVLRTTDEVLDVLRTAYDAALKAMTVVRTRQLFVSNDPRLLPIIGWRDPSGAFTPDDPDAVVDPTAGIFMIVESNEDTPTIPPPADGNERDPSA